MRIFTSLMICSCAALVAAAPEYRRNSYGSSSSGSAMEHNAKPTEHENMDSDVQRAIQYAIESSRTMSGGQRAEYSSHHSSSGYVNPHIEEEDEGQQTEDFGQELEKPNYGSMSSGYMSTNTGGYSGHGVDTSRKVSGYQYGYGYSSTGYSGSGSESSRPTVVGQNAGSSSYGSRGSTGSGYSHVGENVDKEDVGQQTENMGHQVPTSGYNSGYGSRGSSGVSLSQITGSSSYGSNGYSGSGYSHVGQNSDEQQKEKVDQTQTSGYGSRGNSGSSYGSSLGQGAGTSSYGSRGSVGSGYSHVREDSSHEGESQQKEKDGQASGYLSHNNGYGTSGSTGSIHSSTGSDQHTVLGQHSGASIGQSTGSWSYGSRGSASGYSHGGGDYNEDHEGQQKENVGHGIQTTRTTTYGATGNSHTASGQGIVLGQNSGSSRTSYSSGGSGYHGSSVSGQLDDKQKESIGQTNNDSELRYSPSQGGLGYNISSDSHTITSTIGNDKTQSGQASTTGSSRTYASVAGSTVRQDERGENLHRSSTSNYGGRTTTTSTYGGQDGVSSGGSTYSRQKPGAYTHTSEDDDDLGQQVQSAVFPSSDNRGSSDTYFGHSSNKHETTSTHGATNSREHEPMHEINTDDYASHTGNKQIEDAKSLVREQTMGDLLKVAGQTNDKAIINQDSLNLQNKNTHGQHDVHHSQSGFSEDGDSTYNSQRHYASNSNSDRSESGYGQHGSAHNVPYGHSSGNIHDTDLGHNAGSSNYNSRGYIHDHDHDDDDSDIHGQHNMEHGYNQHHGSGYNGHHTREYHMGHTREYHAQPMQHTREYHMGFSHDHGHNPHFMGHGPYHHHVVPGTNHHDDGSICEHDDETETTEQSLHGTTLGIPKTSSDGTVRGEGNVNQYGINIRTVSGNDANRRTGYGGTTLQTGDHRVDNRESSYGIRQGSSDINRNTGTMELDARVRPDSQEDQGQQTQENIFGNTMQTNTRRQSTSGGAPVPTNSDPFARVNAQNDQLLSFLQNARTQQQQNTFESSSGRTQGVSQVDQQTTPTQKNSRETPSSVDGVRRNIGVASNGPVSVLPMETLGRGDQPPRNVEDDIGQKIRPVFDESAGSTFNSQKSTISSGATSTSTINRGTQNLETMSTESTEDLGQQQLVEPVFPKTSVQGSSLQNAQEVGGQKINVRQDTNSQQIVRGATFGQSEDEVKASVQEVSEKETSREQIEVDSTTPKPGFWKRLGSKITNVFTRTT